MAAKRNPSFVGVDEISAFVDLSEGIIARFDVDDAQLVQGRYWSAYRPPRSGLYARASRGKHKDKLHRIIARAAPGDVVDHINGDTLDNRRNNLRICSETENKWNRRPNVGNSSGYKGVCKNGRRWYVEIKVNRKRICVGSYSCRHEAAVAYNKAARHHFGEYAFLNHIELQHD